MDLPIIVLCWLGTPVILGSATPACHRLDKMTCGGGPLPVSLEELTSRLAGILDLKLNNSIKLKMTHRNKLPSPWLAKGPFMSQLV